MMRANLTLLTMMQRQLGGEFVENHRFQGDMAYMLRGHMIAWQGEPGAPWRVAREGSRGNQLYRAFKNRLERRFDGDMHRRFVESGGQEALENTLKHKRKRRR